MRYIRIPGVGADSKGPWCGQAPLWGAWTLRDLRLRRLRCDDGRLPDQLAEVPETNGSSTSRYIDTALDVDVAIYICVDIEIDLDRTDIDIEVF